jgi:hypothetical protein
MHFLQPTGVTSAVGYGEINALGIVTVAYITNAGCGYEDPPTITFDAPTGIGETIGIGTYVFNEVVTGQTSGITAYVKTWTEATATLTVSIVGGEFTDGELLYGEESGAIYILRKQIVDDLVTPYAQNDTLETEADKVLDFSEDNPFGMP